VTWSLEGASLLVTVQAMRVSSGEIRTLRPPAGTAQRCPSLRRSITVVSPPVSIR
jgi:hypothetical protein